MADVYLCLSIITFDQKVIENTWLRELDYQITIVQA
jgi:hypothetical protein